jgi:hypothetical protein
VIPEPESLDAVGSRRGFARLRAVRIEAKHFQASVQIVAGLALNAFPAIFIAVFARVAPLGSQGTLAVCLTIGTYAAQVLCALIIESRLATPDVDHDVSMPWWMATMSLVSGVVLMCGPTVPGAPELLVGVTGLSSGLLMARTIGVVRGRWKLEAAAAVVLITGCLAALVLAIQHNPHCVRVLALGALLAILIRYWPRPAHWQSGLPPDARRAGWVTGETAVVGVIQPTLTSVILVVLGPAASVGFRVVSTISGILEPILAYGRFRQLAHGHEGEVAHVSIIFTAGLAAIFGAAFLGIWSRIFGPAWNHVLIWSLVAACLWKVTMLISTIPFAGLRRAGKTAQVFWLRTTSTVVYVLLGVLFLTLFHSSTAVFLSFALSEIVTFPLYHYAAKKAVPNYHSLFERRTSPEYPQPEAH